MNEQSSTNPTEQEMKEAHTKAFAERPEDFVDMKTLIIAVKRIPNAPVSTFVGPATRAELMLSIAEITRVVDKVITYNEIEAAKGRIVQAKPGVLNRVRGAFGGGKN